MAEQITLFSKKKKRDRQGYGKYSETTWNYLNTSSRPEIVEIRNSLESWFSRYPDDEKERQRNRMIDNDERHFQSAFFELFLHELFLNLGCKLSIEPEMPNTDKKPDFFIECPNGEKFFLEAVVATSKSDEEIAYEKRVNQVYDTLNKYVKSDDYSLGLKIDGAPETPISGRKLGKELNGWLKTLNYEEIEILDRHINFCGELDLFVEQKHSEFEDGFPEVIIEFSDNDIVRLNSLKIPNPDSHIKGVSKTCRYREIFPESTYYLKVDYGSQSPSKKEIEIIKKFTLKTINNDCIIDVIGIDIDKSIDIMPQYSFVESGWDVDFFPIPKRESRGKPDIRPLSLQLPKPFIMTQEKVKRFVPIRQAINRKASRYGEFKIPYIIAINSLNILDLDIDIMNALFREECVRFSANGQIIETRKRDGLLKPNQNTRVSGLLVFKNLKIGNFRYVEYCLFQNPWAKNPCPEFLNVFPQEVPIEGKMESMDGKKIGEIIS